MPTTPDTTAGDAAFAQTLSRVARDVAPAIRVDTAGVVPTARRRRDRRRSWVTASLGVVFLAGVGVSQAPTWGDAPTVVADHGAIAPMSAGLTGPDADSAVATGATSDAGDTSDAGGDAVRLAEPASAGDTALLPAPAAVTLTVAGAGALGAGAWFAVRARRRS